MKLIEIQMAIKELRHATRPDQRTAYERALHALATLVEGAVGAIDGEARREMTDRQLQLLQDLRIAVGISDDPLLASLGRDRGNSWIVKIEQMHAVITGTHADLLKQLRHACSVALGDLVAHGMPSDSSTGLLLQNALRALGEKPWP